MALRQDKLYITPSTCAAAYEYFRTTLPFRRWNLPHSDSVAFRITKSAKLFGSVYYPSREGHTIRPIIEISDHLCYSTEVLFRTLAHELCHLRQFQLDGWTVVDKDKEYGHGPDFQAMAKLICRRHGFELDTF
jgi:hypothetical protein